MGSEMCIRDSLGPMVEAVFKERKKDGESIVRFLDKVCQVEF